MSKFDVIVVGAGPAGSTAAQRIASDGASVLVLDRARFPRDKPCGGGLTIRGVRMLPFSVDPVVEQVVDRLAFRRGYGPGFERGSGAPIVFMTQRRRLDAFLVEKAAEAGADVRQGVRVRSVECSPAGVTVSADGERYEAQIAIGADGCNGPSAKALGLEHQPTYGVALEGNLPYDRHDGQIDRGRAIFELEAVPGGYAWVFPKGDHANFGVGGWESEGPKLRDYLRRLCAEHGVPFDSLDELRGWRLPTRRPGARIVRERALLVGDAAGLVDPFSGDGIYEAILSSKMAAEGVSDLLAGRASSLAPYQARIDGALSRHRTLAWVGKLGFEHVPGVAWRVARSRLLWPFVERRLRGDGLGSRPRRHPGPGRPRLESLMWALYRPQTR